MCGIIGWLNPELAGNSQELLSAADRIAHRGPDDLGTYLNPEVGIALAHLRLSIIDLSPAGHQPMMNEDGTVLLVFNGEIYNFKELREQLLQAGHLFRSQTDSEVLVHGYEQWGESLVDRLCGMYAFAVWDTRINSLFLARDPMGMKPLYYWWSKNGGFHFASEIKAFLGLRGFRSVADRRMLRQFLELNFLSDLHRSSLEGVYKLPGGHTLRVTREDVQVKRRPDPKRFFIPPQVEPCIDSDEHRNKRIDRLYETLDEVVQQHMVADVPVGILLSGGLDSSVVASLAARHTSVRTISMAFAESSVDELPFARIVSKHIGSQHEEIVIRPEEITGDLQNAIRYIDDLFGDYGTISTRLLYKRCRDAGVKVVLVGEGSDELFAGYPNFLKCGGQESDRTWVSWRILQLYRWYSGRRWGSELRPFYSLLRSLYYESKGDFFSTIRLFETRHQLPHHFNMKVDKASMAVSVEARVPFLDVRVAREGYKTPRELLLRDGTNKWLLRQMAERHRLLPTEICRREKFGASMAASWMDEVPGFRSFAREVILDSGGMTAELGMLPAMKAYFEEGERGYRFPHGVSIFSIVAWRLLLLNLWARSYLTTIDHPTSPA